MWPASIRGALGFLAVVIASIALLPATPVVSTRSGNDTWSGLLSYVIMFAASTRQDTRDAEAPQVRVDVEETFARQPRLVEAALASIAPSRPDRSELYVVSMGAFAEQDVFWKEASAARTIFEDRMDAAGRTVLLVNNQKTAADLPLANGTNLTAVMDRLGTVMDKEKDVLVLFMTSHGAENRFSVSFDGFSFNDLTPKKLAAILERSGVRHRVVIISACHSGSFIEALQNEHTMVMTASRADRSSFGCSNERDWTYFGDAFFNHALARSTRSLQAAFDEARGLVAAWEKRDKLSPPSEPQISSGAIIRQKLDDITHGLEARAQATATEVSR